MTEQEWLECNDSLKILDFVRRKTSERKLRLFAAACYRRVWRVLKEIERTKVEATENYADGRITNAQSMRKMSHRGNGALRSDGLMTSKRLSANPRL